MKRRLLVWGLALVVMASRAGADDLDDVRRLDEELTVATWTGDSVWFEENVAEEYVLITPTGARRNKKDIIRELATTGMKMEPYEPSEVLVRIYGDAAVVTGRVLQKFTLGGLRYANDLRYTDIWVKRKGRWLLVSAHISAIAARR